MTGFFRKLHLAQQELDREPYNSGNWRRVNSLLGRFGQKGKENYPDFDIVELINGEIGDVKINDEEFDVSTKYDKQVPRNLMNASFYGVRDSELAERRKVIIRFKDGVELYITATHTSDKTYFERASVEKYHKNNLQKGSTTGSINATLEVELNPETDIKEQDISFRSNSGSTTEDVRNYFKQALFLKNHLENKYRNTNQWDTKYKIICDIIESSRIPQYKLAINDVKTN